MVYFFVKTLMSPKRKPSSNPLMIWFLDLFPEKYLYDWKGPGPLFTEIEYILKTKQCQKANELSVQMWA